MENYPWDRFAIQPLKWGNVIASELFMCLRKKLWGILTHSLLGKMAGKAAQGKVSSQTDDF